MSYFSYKKRVAYYETDAMAVVHHSNYVRYFEECRVHWYNERGLDKINWPGGDRVVLAVIEAHAQFRRPAKFNEVIDVHMQTRFEGNRQIYFQYAIFNGNTEKLLCTGSTLHIPVNQDFKVVRRFDANLAPPAQQFAQPALTARATASRIACS